jgi:hypothetical protein
MINEQFNKILARRHLVRAALDYARQGFPVIPLHSPTPAGCSCRKKCSTIGKHPRTPHGLKDSTKDEATIKDWWGKWPDANIGIVTGSCSCLIVLDIDPRHGGDESLLKLQEQYGELPETPKVKTGGGGKHLYFRLPENLLIKNTTNFAGFLGLDIRGENGYVVAPPSLHESGVRYEWEN